MSKVNITLTIDEERLNALEFSLKKENSSVQAKMDEALRQLYEKTVPEPLREYLDSKTASSAKPRRPVKPAPAKLQPGKTDPVVAAAPVPCSSGPDARTENQAPGQERTV